MAKLVDLIQDLFLLLRVGDNRLEVVSSKVALGVLNELVDLTGHVHLFQVEEQLMTLLVVELLAVSCLDKQRYDQAFEVVDSWLKASQSQLGLD